MELVKYHVATIIDSNITLLEGFLGSGNDALTQSSLKYFNPEKI